MAMVYAAIANGGKLYQPQIAKAIVGADGTVVKEFEPILKSRVDVPKSTIKFLRASLPGVTTNGSGEPPFAGFPLDQIPVASKTGSAQVTGSDVSTSWFASYAPANKPRYAVVMMVTKGGTGSKTVRSERAQDLRGAVRRSRAASSTRARACSSAALPMADLPTIRPDGTPVDAQGQEVRSGVDAGAPRR